MGITMDERKRRRPFGFGFDDDFFGGEFERMREEMEEMMHFLEEDIRKDFIKRFRRIFSEE
ncbi:MAG: hypothetical protein NTY83_00570 [Candidatus Micrarchaeota archaeon]|nr:hypothetical protein [Candidatus Micrarchaeota archaeon]